MDKKIVVALVALLAAPVFAASADAPAGDAPTCASCQSLEIGELIARFAKRTGRQFIIDPRVRGTVSLAGIDPDKVDWEQLLAILNVHYFAAVAQGRWTLVVPDANARQLPTPVYTDRNFKAAPDEIVTLILPVKNICAAQTVPILRPLMPQMAHMAAFVETNTLIINDHAVNVKRIAAFVDALERNGTGCVTPPKPVKE